MSAQADVVDAQSWKALYEAAVKQLQEERVRHLLCQQERDDWRELALALQGYRHWHEHGDSQSFPADVLDRVIAAEEVLGL